jgi:hypothetical protein
VTDAVSQLALTCTGLRLVVTSAIVLEAWNSLAVTPTTGRNCRHAAKEFAFGDSELTMTGDRRDISGQRQTFQEVESCSVGEARWRFLGRPG